MLFDVIFKYDSKQNPFVMARPEIATKIGPSQSYIMPQMELSNYNTGFHFADVERALMKRTAVWDSNTNTLNYKTANNTGSWSYDGQNLTAKLKSQKISYNLHMRGGSQVMWAKDRTCNKEGFIQEGALGNVSFYYSHYSLPRLIVSGNISYMDESGNPRL
jgi:hypothetical protein